jgi:adenylosuccinate synthase
MFDSKTRTLVVVGAQWGDEGKGKLVDVLAEQADWVVRYQGGANAGHTVHIGDVSFVLHQIPSGILHPGVRCAIGNGVVLDPDTLFHEIDELVGDGIDVEGRLYVQRARAPRAAVPQAGGRRERGEQGDRHDGARHRARPTRTRSRAAACACSTCGTRSGCASWWSAAPRTPNAQLSTFGLGERVDVEETLALLARLAPRLLPLAEDVGLCIHRAQRTAPRCCWRGAGVAARRRPRHVPVRDVEQHDVGRGGDRRRDRADGHRRRARAW